MTLYLKSFNIPLVAIRKILKVKVFREYTLISFEGDDSIEFDKILLNHNFHLTKESYTDPTLWISPEISGVQINTISRKIRLIHKKPIPFFKYWFTKKEFNSSKT